MDSEPDPGQQDPPKRAGAASEEEKRPRVVVAVQDDAIRERLGDVLDPESLELEVIDPGGDPLAAPPELGTDLLVVRRSVVRPEDLRLVDAYTEDGANPGLVVVQDGAGDADRARLLAAGASMVVESGELDRELRGSVAALADVRGRGASRDPHAGGESDAPRLADFRSRSPRMRRFLDLVHRVVDSDSSLLITGETGVGKERLAQAVHNESPRAGGPFVSVNCGALPESLMESELFGHEAGAFTGAAGTKRGRFEQANGGTIFLDEVGEMPLHLQVRLLTVLQRRRIQRVGSEESIPIDVRVMAATNRDVHEEVEAGRFRQDLYYRLNVVSLDIPPLRERVEDIPDLVGSFIRHFRGSLGRRQVEGIGDEALEAMMRWPWPGNVRELVNAVEHAIVLCRGSEIGLEDLPDRVRTGDLASEPTPPGVAAPPAPRAAEEPVDTSLSLREAKQASTDRFERRYLEAQLRRAGGRVGDAAELCGISARALYSKMKRYGLRKEDFRPA